ncbi:Ig-like domain-containing protein [bacterium]|nr:Ig-like domain-containing protein [bacterium]
MYGGTRNIFLLKRIVGILFLSVLLVTPGFAQGKNPQYKVRIDPGSAELSYGETAQFTAKLVAKDGTEKDTTFEWSVTRPLVGSVTQDGLFSAQGAGVTHVVATAGRLSAKAMVKVLDESKGSRDLWQIYITPGDTLLVPGDTVRYSARMVDTLGNVADTAFAWSTGNTDVAMIDSDGTLAALAKGQTFVYARAGALYGKVHMTILRTKEEKNTRMRGYKILVTPRDTLLIPGESIQYTAALVDTSGNEIDTSFTWSYEGAESGTITEDGFFSALARGNGFVYAHAGTLAGKGHVNVVDTVGTPPKVDGWRLMISPSDTLVALEEQVQYEAFLMDTLGNRIDTTLELAWWTQGREVGEIDADGLFTADGPGVGIVRVQSGKYKGIARVVVANREDLMETDSVHVQFRLEDRQIGNTYRIGGKEYLEISGLPFPLDVLNGGQLIFQPGTLDENIRIEVTLSCAATVEDSVVTFADRIFNGIAFHVYIGDSLASPYYFDPPVELVLPYNQNLLDTLGITVDDLWIYFYSDSSGFEDQGITNIIVDEDNQKIYAEVHHFSDLVISVKGQTSTDIDQPAFQPFSHQLFANYPNPFNPETVIRFELAGATAKRVTLTIYDILGRKVKTLVDEVRQPGTYNVTWSGSDARGGRMSSGVYIYRLEIGAYVSARRMILIR